MTIQLKMLYPTGVANSATAFQELSDIKHSLSKMQTERWTISGFLDHTEANIVDESWKWTLLVPGTAAAGNPSLSALSFMYKQTAVSAAANAPYSANLIQLVWVDPNVNAAVTATAYFNRMSDPQYLTPYNFLVAVDFRKYQGT